MIRIFLIVALVVGIAMAALFYKSPPKPQPTIIVAPSPLASPAFVAPDDWKTYSGTGFTIKYPSTYFLAPPRGTGGERTISGDPKDKSPLMLNIVETTASSEPSDNQSLANRMEGGTKVGENVPFDLVNIAGNQFIKTNRDNKIKYVLLAKDEVIFIVASPADSSEIGQLDQIMSTFQLKASK